MNPVKGRSKIQEIKPEHKGSRGLKFANFAYILGVRLKGFLHSNNRASTSSSVRLLSTGYIWVAGAHENRGQYRGWMDRWTDDRWTDVHGRMDRCTVGSQREGKSFLRKEALQPPADLPSESKYHGKCACLFHSFSIPFSRL